MNDLESSPLSVGGTELGATVSYRQQSIGGEVLKSPKGSSKLELLALMEEEVAAARPEKKKGIAKFIDSKSKLDLAYDNFSNEEITAFEKAFKMFDVDGNGTLDIAEMEKVFKQLEKPMSRDEILDLLYDVDLGKHINANGFAEIGKDDFIQMMAGEKKFKTRDLAPEENKMMQQIFELFDGDEKGYWSYDDFTQYFNAIEFDAVLEFTEDNFVKVNGLLGAKDTSQMTLQELKKFYTIEDRTMASDMLSDYRRCCE